MNRFFPGLVVVLISINQLFAATNAVETHAGIYFTGSDTNDPVEIELKKLMRQDDAAREEIDRWILENNEFAQKGAGLPRSEMNRRIMERFKPIRQGYEALIQRHTNNVGARIAFSSFLEETADEPNAIIQLEIARQLDTSDPAVWNNLANLHGHSGSVKKAFEYYAKAIELKGDESLYYHNFGTTVFLFRKDAKEYYSINEQQVFDKAMSLYSNAIRLAPGDFEIAADVAQTYYGIKPPRTDDALRAWTNAFNLARDDNDREGVHVHFARILIQAGRLPEARAHLNSVTNEAYAESKRLLTRNLNGAEEKLSSTNAAPQTNSSSRPVKID